MKIIKINNNFTMAIRGIWFHIDSNKKKKFYVVFILTLFTSILEVLSIGSIIPFLNVITNQNYIINIENKLPSYLQIQEIPQVYLIYFFTAFFIFSILTTNILRILTLKYLTYLSHEIGSDLSTKIYRKAIYQSYESHTVSNSSSLIDAIVNKSSLSIYFVNLMIILLNSFTILFFLIVSTVYISPFVSILSIIIIGLIYYKIAVKNKINLSINGQIISHNSKKIQQHLQEGFGSIREILLSSSQEIFCNIYSKSEIQLRKAQASNIIIGMYPRFIMETVGIVLITLYALVMLVFSHDQQSNNSTMAFIGALALAAQRILPLIQQVYSSWAGLSGANESITELINYLNLPNSCISLNKNNNFKFNNNIMLKNISFKYNSNQKNLLFENINIDISKGSKIGFIGTTGSGKSSLIDLIMALLNPISGKLLIDNIEINNNNRCNWQSYITHVPQHIFLSDSSIAENIAFGIEKNKINYARIEQCLKVAELYETVNKMPDNFNTTIGERGILLSGGQRQRIGIARALYKEAEVLVLDEATSSLDSKTEKLIMENLMNSHKNLTYLIVAHRLSTLSFCDKIIEIKNGIIHIHESPLIIQKLTNKN